MNMKKLVALLLALVMVFALCACGPKDNQDTGKKDDGKKTAMKADDIPDEMTSSDGKYQVAFVTDVGDLKDKSFNQGTYDGVKLYASANSKSYKYYKPANGDKATDDDRYDAMKAAVDNGAEVVVAAGFLQGSLRLAARTAAAFHDDADGALLEFLVAGLDVDHEVAIDFAQADHGACRQHVGDHLLGRAGFHARRARDDFRADDGAEVDVGTTADG